MDADIDLVDVSGLPLTTRSLATPGLMLNPGTLYQVDVDVTVFGDFFQPTIGGNPSQFASFYSSDNISQFMVPEPSLTSLVVSGVLALAWARRRR